MAAEPAATNGKSDAAGAPPEVPGGLTADILTKYKTAGEIANKSISAVLEKCTEGANLLSICQDGDKLVEEGCAAVYNKDKKKPTPKGIAFPCTVSVNNVVCHFSPLPSDPSASQTLKKDDVVKVLLGAHIDGYPAAVGETIIVGASSAAPAKGVKADLLSACFNATEAALRFVKPGAKNWDVTDAVKRVLAEYGGSIKGVEGMVSHQHEQNSIGGKKTINLFPAADQHRDKDSTFVFEEGEVYGLDVCLTTGEEAKPKSLGDRTTIFQKTASTYQLKMKTSRSTFSEIANKAGSFPFTLRTLDEEQKARMGVKECVQHGLLKEFDMSTTADPKDFTAQTFVTFSVTKTGASRITPSPNFYTGSTSEKVKSEVKIKDEELSALLARSLKVGKKKSKSTSKDGDKV